MRKKKAPTKKQTLVRPDGTTTCCNAYTSIGVDDSVEYCKACYEAVAGYLGDAVFQMPTRIDIP